MEMPSTIVKLPPRRGVSKAFSASAHGQSGGHFLQVSFLLKIRINSVVIGVQFLCLRKHFFQVSHVAPPFFYRFDAAVLSYIDAVKSTPAVPDACAWLHSFCRFPKYTENRQPNPIRKRSPILFFGYHSHACFCSHTHYPVPFLSIFPESSRRR